MYMYNYFMPFPLVVCFSLSVPHLVSTDRQKLISSDICFQSKAPSLVFPLCGPVIIELTYVLEQTTREYPSAGFLSSPLVCSSALSPFLTRFQFIGQFC